MTACYDHVLKVGRLKHLFCMFFYIGAHFTLINILKGPNITSQAQRCKIQTYKHTTRQICNTHIYLLYLHWPKMKTLHLFCWIAFCLYACHVRSTHAYRDIVADNDCAIFIQIPGLFKHQRLKNVFLTLHVLRNRWFTLSFKTDKKTFAAEYW